MTFGGRGTPQAWISAGITPLGERCDRYWGLEILCGRRRDLYGGCGRWDFRCGRPPKSVHHKAPIKGFLYGRHGQCGGSALGPPVESPSPTKYHPTTPPPQMFSAFRWPILEAKDARDILWLLKFSVHPRFVSHWPSRDCLLGSHKFGAVSSSC